MHTIVVKSGGVPPWMRPFEVVERKGLGHPDSIADGVAEAVSRGLSSMYIETTGGILHHNVDKVHLIAGSAKAEFGSAEVLEPTRIIIGGRATFKHGGEDFSVEGVSISAARRYLTELCGEKIANSVLIECRLGNTSSNLEHIYDERGTLSNDTSFGVGFAPLSETEQVVLDAEEYVRKMSEQERGIGKDIKVMGMRYGKAINLTVAVAIEAEKVHDAHEYNSLLDELESSLLWELSDSVTVSSVNPERSGGMYYLTATGYSWENGDDGAVGRGNRANGLITPGRSMSLEAVAGKNPVNHTGKLYNLLALEVADEIAAVYPEVKDSVVTLVSGIGSPVREPVLALTELYVNCPIDKFIPGISAIVCDALDNMNDLRERIFAGSVRMF